MTTLNKSLARHAFDNTDRTLTLDGIAALARDCGVVGYVIRTVAMGVKCTVWDESCTDVVGFGETEQQARRDALNNFIEQMSS